MEHENLNIEETANSDLGAVMRSFLLAMADGKYKCDVEYPGFRDVKCKVIGVDFTNLSFRPIHIHFLEKLTQEITEYEPAPFSYDSDATIPVKKRVPITDTWVSVRCLKNYA
jgi:hypothetical protein